jgi:hypothetical protein
MIFKRCRNFSITYFRMSILTIRLISFSIPAQRHSKYNTMARTQIRWIHTNFFNSRFPTWRRFLKTHKYNTIILISLKIL